MSTMVAAALIYSNDLTEARRITAAALRRATYFIFRSHGTAGALGKGCSRLEIKMKKSNAKRLLFDMITQRSP